MPDIHIKNTKVFFNNYLQPAEVAIEDGKITKIAKDIHVSSVDCVIDRWCAHAQRGLELKFLFCSCPEIKMLQYQFNLFTRIH